MSKTVFTGPRSNLKRHRVVVIVPWDKLGVIQGRGSRPFLYSFPSCARPLASSPCSPATPYSSNMATALILGRISEGSARCLLSYLVPPDKTPLVSHIRVVDKHLCVPASNVFLAYIDPISRKVFQQGKGVEYVQGNLLIQGTALLRASCLQSRGQGVTSPTSFSATETRTKVFTRPDDPAKAYDYVFDFTGETDYGAEEIVSGHPSSPSCQLISLLLELTVLQVHIERTAKLAAHLGRAAASKGGVKAYVRILGSEYQAKDARSEVSVKGKAVCVRSDTPNLNEMHWPPGAKQGIVGGRFESEALDTKAKMVPRSWPCVGTNPRVSKPCRIWLLRITILMMIGSKSQSRPGSPSSPLRTVHGIAKYVACLALLHKNYGLFKQTHFASVTARLLICEIYRFIGEKMELLYVFPSFSSSNLNL
jgi:hypothetical protein